MHAVKLTEPGQACMQQLDSSETRSSVWSHKLNIRSHKLNMWSHKLSMWSHKPNNVVTQRYKEDLGNAVVNFARMVPDGLLCFFPSYIVLDKCIEHWKNSECFASHFLICLSLWSRFFAWSSLGDTDALNCEAAVCTCEFRNAEHKTNT